MGVPVVQTSYYFDDSLTGLIDPTLAAPVKLAAAKQGLSAGDFTPNVATVYGDMTLPTFTGYAVSATIVWGAPLNEPDGSKTSLSPAALFRATAVPTPESIYGGFIGDGVAAPATGILGSYKLDEPFPIQNPGDGFSVVIGWNMGQNGSVPVANINS